MPNETEYEVKFNETTNAEIEATRLALKQQLGLSELPNKVKTLVILIKLGSKIIECANSGENIVDVKNVTFLRGDRGGKRIELKEYLNKNKQYLTEK